MWSLLAWRGLVLTILTRVAIALPNPGNWSQWTDQLIARHDVEFEPGDLSHIRRLSAVGDSYSAGIGAGNRLGIVGSLFTQSDWACSRYDQAYPYVVSQDERFEGDNGGPNFQFKSCSGAVAKDVLEKQIPYLDNGQDAIMLSVGGNDAELSNILNACVFQWAHINKLQELLLRVDDLLDEAEKLFGWKPNWDLERMARTCDEQLTRTEGIVNSAEFSNTLDNVVRAAKGKLSLDGQIYWTGYAKFFGTSLTRECDSVSWTIFIHNLYSDFRSNEKLTVDHRRRMNALVDLVNSKVKAAAERASVVFVDYDDYVGRFSGRYCEPGVDESTSNDAAKHRSTLMFYEMNAADLLGKTPWKRSEEQHAQDTFSGEMNILAWLTTKLDPEARFASPHVQSSSAAGVNALALASDGNFPDHVDLNLTKALDVSALADNWEIGVPNFIPDGYGRVFHPTVLLHNLIAEKVMWHMMDEKVKRNGLGGVQERLSIGGSCPVGSNPANPPSFYARVMPLGASIVYGYGSSSGNGFRKPLRDTMRQDGWKVNMVGDHNAGNMVDSNVEAHPGYRIAEISAEADKSIKYQPNIILINAGTNDANGFYEIESAGSRYAAMFDKLQREIPGVTIIVSTILPGTGDGVRAHRDNINNQLRQLVRDRRGRGERIVLADVDIPSGYLTTDLIPDGTHPNDEGHRRLAAIFYRGIKEARRANMIQAPKDTGMSDEPGAGSGSNTCDKVFGSGNSYGPVTTQQGSGLEDGIYAHSSQPQGLKWTYNGFADSASNYTFARLSEPFGRHEVLLVGMQWPGSDPQTTGPGWYVAYRPDGNGGWKDKREFWLQDKCIYRGVRFADVNADGLDDMICVSPNGDTYVSINRGNYNFDGPKLWKSNVGMPQARVRLADIDGDGRKDYCVIADDGNISCWRNGGQGDLPEYWQELGVVFTGKGMGDVNGVRFADINGDGRDDWLWINDQGQIWTWTNNRGCTKGTLAPLWREASASPSHGGMGKNVGRDSIHIVNVFNSPSAFSLRGRGDYVWVERTGGRLDFRVWRNTGGGSTKLRADGVKYCKMIDRPNKAMDYIWTHSTGYLHIYESLGGKFPPNPGYWGNNYIFWRATDYLGHEVDRRDLHLADWDGDGLCDIIYVNPDNGYVDGLWLNKYKTTRDLSKPENWQRVNDAGPRGSNKPCPERRGTHIYDLAVRFADIDGNGRTDYLCIEKDGRTWGYLNNDNGLTYISQFKKTEGKDRVNLRFVDVNGDGKDDMLWIDKFNGDGSVWYNKGPIPASGSAFTWEGKGTVYQGAAQGHCEHFPDLDGNGRADLHVTDSVANTAVTWFNKCPGEDMSTNGDDADTMTSPKVTIP